MNEEINRMFSEIHDKYDLMNHTMSLGADRMWRNAAAKHSVTDKGNCKILDIACGTGDLTIAIKRLYDKDRKNANVVGIDFNKDMLKIAKAKAKRHGVKIGFEIGDAMKLRFHDNSFDVVASGFALRDFDDLSKFIKESHRVLNSGGKLVLLEMSKPDSGIMRYLFKIYFRIMTLEGMLVNRNAYSFLVSSIMKFDKEKLVKLIEKRGFKDVTLTNLPSGVAFIVTARKIS